MDNDATGFAPSDNDQPQRPENSTSGGQSAGRQEAEAAAGQVKRQAFSIFDQAKDKVIAVASTQKDGLAGQIENLAHSVHKAGEPFVGQQEWIADAIERGAAELNVLASSLRDNDLGALVGQARAIAQRQPAVFAGLCLAGGIAVARIGKLVAADLSRADLPSLPEVGHGAQ